MQTTTSRSSAAKAPIVSFASLRTHRPIERRQHLSCRFFPGFAINPIRPEFEREHAKLLHSLKILIHRVAKRLRVFDDAGVSRHDRDELRRLAEQFRRGKMDAVD